MFAAITLVLGWLAHSLGRDLAAGQPLPYELLSLLVSVVFVWMTWRRSQYTHVRFERLSPDLLLTTVSARTAALGLLGFVYARLITTLILPTLGVAVAIAIGLRSPTVAVTVLVAVAGLVVLAVALGTTSRLAARLVALRLTRVRFYRDLLVVFGWIPLFVGAMILQELSISLAPLLAVFSVLPLAWFVDLALVGSVEFAFGSVGRSRSRCARTPRTHGPRPRSRVNRRRTPNLGDRASQFGRIGGIERLTLSRYGKSSRAIRR
ncbi:hypothetical protein C497_06549 [Halalkalicoccus jeotgali B3]|uniref:Uncharacterized protein n=1 Tax=Halalkalicoccus jeotgali (strain DSM 18796 / CECT 7217 / JCM 14584 / KCTC 4019 / B3) TaxID=795797 RepID=D8JCA9_HALJB|nr:hypothetical protein HacjB3_18368 [Halalkalicoccus jeotgali B3]ELY38821.1 hypothetical protein C497_06549 [Halalkalicoccus jeotgali B3]